MSDTTGNRVATLAAQIVTSYLNAHPIATEQVPVLVRSVVDTLADLATGASRWGGRLPDLWGAYLAATTKPAVKPKRVAQPGKRMGRPRNSETTQCHFCNRRFRDLTTHLKQAHGVTRGRPASGTLSTGSSPG